MKTHTTTIDEYIASFPHDVQERLRTIRSTIRTAAPGAEEKISYRMPTFTFHGNLVHFAAYARHIGFYPTPSGIQAFEHALASYETSKGAVQFPHDRPLPLGLIAKIVKFRVKENRQSARARKTSTPAAPAS